MKQMLADSGFKDVKVWEQPINVYFKDGEDFVTKFGDGRLNMEAKSKNLLPEQVQQMRKEAVDLFDELSGNKTTDLKTFQIAVILAFKE